MTDWSRNRRPALDAAIAEHMRIRRQRIFLLGDNA